MFITLFRQSFFLGGGAYLIFNFAIGPGPTLTAVLKPSVLEPFHPRANWELSRCLYGLSSAEISYHWSDHNCCWYPLVLTLCVVSLLNDAHPLYVSTSHVDHQSPAWRHVLSWRHRTRDVWDSSLVGDPSLVWPCQDRPYWAVCLARYLLRVSIKICYS